MDRRPLHPHPPQDHRQRPRRTQQAPVDHLRRRRRPRVGREPQLRPRRQQAAHTAERRTPQHSAQRAHHVRGAGPSLRHIGHCVTLWHDLVQRACAHFGHDL